MKNPPESIKQALIDHLKIDNPKYYEAVKRGFSTYNLKPHIYNFDILPDESIRIPRGMRSVLLDMVQDQDFKLTDQRTLFDYQDYGSAHIKYYPYQETAVTQLMGKDEGFFIAPAGSGKTVVGLSMVPLFGQPSLWLTHTRQLFEQAQERIKQYLPSLKDDDVGVIGSGKWKPGRVITVSLIPTLVRRPVELHKIRNDYGLVILDEAHHCPASTFLKVVGALNPYYFYALTATPYRRDKLDPLMFQAIGPEIVRIKPEEVEKYGGIMMPTVLYRTVHSKPVYHNKIQTILKENIVENDKRNNLIVGDVLREAVGGNYCIVLTDRKVHAERLFELISIGWENTGIATGNYSKKYVSEQASRLNDKEITVLVCTFALLGEGFDVPFLNRAFMTMPFRAEGKVEQLIGRIQRPADGKKDAIVYDYVDADIGVLVNQFYHKGKNDCRHKAYTRLGLKVQPYE